MTPQWLAAMHIGDGFKDSTLNDRFRLAVIIHYLLYYLLFGNHPCPNTIPLKILHPKVEQCFLKCFNDGHQSPTSRPSPDDWFDALQMVINHLVVCNTNAKPH